MIDCSAKRPIPYMFFFFCAATLLSGCGMRPSPVVPEDLTVRFLLETLDGRASRIRDFTGTAFVRMRGGDGSPESVKLSIRYIRPGRFRILVKGFAGIPVALISSAGDSLTVFFPSENTYVTGEYGEGLLRELVPGIDVDIWRITSVLTGYLPPPEERGRLEKSLERMGKDVVLVMRDENVTYRYTVSGKHLDVVGEEIIRGGRTVWSGRASGFRSHDGTRFPRRVSVRTEEGAVDIEFSGCRFNTGLKESEIAFTVPPSAERLAFPDES